MFSTASRWERYEFQAEEAFDIMESGEKMRGILHDYLRDTCLVILNGHHRPVHETNEEQQVLLEAAGNFFL